MLAKARAPVVAFRVTYARLALMPIREGERFGGRLMVGRYRFRTKSNAYLQRSASKVVPISRASQMSSPLHSFDPVLDIARGTALSRSELCSRIARVCGG